MTTRYCRECASITNHSTEQHREQQRLQMLCESCGEVEKMDDDPDTKWCRACWEEEQYYKFADWCDNRGKETNHGEA